MLEKLSIISLKLLCQILNFLSSWMQTSHTFTAETNSKNLETITTITCHAYNLTRATHFERTTKPVIIQRSCSPNSFSTELLVRYFT